MSHTEVNAGQQPPSGRQVYLGLVAVFITYFASSYYFRSSSIAAPKIAADLNGMALYSWAISLPALASAFVTLTFGRLSDMYGRRIMLIVSLVLFAAGAILSAISQTFVFYIAATIILCLGRGAIAPLCFSVVGDLFAPAQRSRWSGLLNIPAGIASIVSPTLVGMITDKLSWRYFFWIIVPLAMVSVVFVLWGVPSPVQRARHKIDFLGAFLLAVASSAMILGFSWAGATYSWASVQILGLHNVDRILGNLLPR
jgi:MFS family permease